MYCVSCLFLSLFTAAQGYIHLCPFQAAALGATVPTELRATGTTVKLLVVLV